MVALLPDTTDDAKINEQTKVLAGYNEGIAVAVRAGAPLAAYAIDRRCTRNYAEALRDDGVQSLICFCCERSFPYINGRSSNEIAMETVLRTEDRSGHAEMRFCGMSTDNVANRDNLLIARILGALWTLRNRSIV